MKTYRHVAIWITIVSLVIVGALIGHHYYNPPTPPAGTVQDGGEF